MLNGRGGHHAGVHPADEAPGRAGGGDCGGTEGTITKDEGRKTKDERRRTINNE